MSPASARPLILLLLLCSAAPELEAQRRVRRQPEPSVGGGLTALLRGRPADAAPLFERLLAARPGGVAREAALFYLGYAQEKLGRTPQALARYGELLRVAPGSRYAPQATYRSARLQELVGRPASALALYQQVATRHPQQFRLALLGRFNGANLKLLDNDLRGARASYGAAVTLHSQQPPAAKAAYRYYARAADQRMQFMARYDGEPRALQGFLTAVQHKKAGRLGQAAALLDRLASAHASSKLSAAIRHELATCRFEQARWDDVLRACDKFENLYPDYNGLPAVLALRSKATIRRCEVLVEEVARSREPKIMLSRQEKLQTELLRLWKQVEHSRARVMRMQMQSK